MGLGLDLVYPRTGQPQAGTPTSFSRLPYTPHLNPTLSLDAGVTVPILTGGKTKAPEE